MARRIDELDYYRLLGLASTASSEEIQRAFHAFARKYHPDVHGEDERATARYAAVYRRGTEAYRVLRIPAARAAYDEGLRTGKLRYQGSLTRSVPPPAKPARKKKRKRGPPPAPC